MEGFWFCPAAYPESAPDDILWCTVKLDPDRGLRSYVVGGVVARASNMGLGLQGGACDTVRYSTARNCSYKTKNNRSTRV